MQVFRTLQLFRAFPRINSNQLRSIVIFSFLISVTSHVAGATELITNGSFSSNFSGWTLDGYDSWAGTNLSNYRTSPGYAALGVDSSGYAKNGANGAFYQTISIPSNATSVTLRFWYYISTNEASSVAYDKLFVSVRNANGAFLAYAAELDNSDKSNSYVQKSFDLTPYKDIQSLIIRFGATSDSTETTTFRIDDVSVSAEIPSTVATLPVSPTPQSPGTVSSPGPVLTSTTQSLSWSSESGADYYQVALRDIDADKLVVDASTPSNTYLVSSLSTGHAFRWNVSACNTVGCSPFSSRLFFQINEEAPISSSIPAPPQSLVPGGTSPDNATTLEGTTQSLQWDGVAGAASYKLYLYDWSTGQVVINHANIGASTSYELSSAVSGHTYQWSVSACNNAGCSQYEAYRYFSIKSNVSSATDKGIKNLSVHYDRVTNRIIVSWDHSAFAGSTYQVNTEQKTTTPNQTLESSWRNRGIEFGDGDIREYVYPLPDAGTQYCYRIAWDIQGDSSGYSDFSDPICLTVVAEDFLPQDIEVVTTSDNGITIQVKDAYNALNLERSLNNGDFKQIAYFNSTVNFDWTDTDVEQGNSYCYRFRRDKLYTQLYCATFGATSTDSNVIGFEVDIKANNGDGPVYISENSNLNITISIDTIKNTDADWWLIASTIYGLYHYNGAEWKQNMDVMRQAPLSNITSLSVLNGNLPPGNYTFYFGIDLIQNRDLDLDGDIFLYDSVDVSVAKTNLVFKLPLPNTLPWYVTVQAGGAACDGTTDPYHLDDNNTYYSIDFAPSSTQSSNNIPILAAADGEVMVAIPNDSNNGNYVVLTHGDSEYTTRYLHMQNSSLTVKKGDRVVQGQKLGLMGNTGASLGVHLHFGLQYNGNSISSMPELYSLLLDGRLLKDYQVCNAYESTNVLVQ